MGAAALVVDHGASSTVPSVSMLAARAYRSYCVPISNTFAFPWVDEPGMLGGHEALGHLVHILPRVGLHREILVSLTHRSCQSGHCQCTALGRVLLPLPGKERVVEPLQAHRVKHIEF